MKKICQYILVVLCFVLFLVKVEAGGANQSVQEALEGGNPINSALRRIPDGEERMGDAGGLFLLKEYGTEMNWAEAKQIGKLDRGTPATETGEYYTYFLVLPKYVGSRVEVCRVSWDGADFSPTKTIYLNESTPDDYGLILTSTEPDAAASLSVTVTHAEKKYRYLFLGDGRGDRPAVRVFPRDE